MLNPSIGDYVSLSGGGLNLHFSFQDPFGVLSCERRRHFIITASSAITTFHHNVVKSYEQGTVTPLYEQQEKNLKAAGQKRRGLVWQRL